MSDTNRVRFDYASNFWAAEHAIDPATLPLQVSGEREALVLHPGFHFTKVTNYTAT